MEIQLLIVWGNAHGVGCLQNKCLRLILGVLILGMTCSSGITRCKKPMRNAFILVYPWDTHQQVPWQKREKKKRSGTPKNKMLTPTSISSFETPTFCGCNIL
jgi:hypothetical protein